MKKVSVIVPVYNAERYLRKCMDSLVGQTLEDIEILTVDDGSTDGSLAILRDYESKYPEKVRVFHKENGGQATARNLALDVATGEYIGCVDSDDYVDTRMFELLCAEADRTGLDVVACDSYELIGDTITATKRCKDYADKRELVVDAWVSPCVKIVRRTVYEKGNIRFPEGYIYEDTAWFAYLLPYINGMGNVHEPLYYRIFQENSTMTTKQGERTAQIFPVMESVFDFYRSRGVYEEYKNEVERFYVRILLLGSLERISRIEDRALRRKLTKKTWEEIRTHVPDYKKNPYLYGKKGLALKLMNRVTIGWFVAGLHLWNKTKKR